MRGHPKLRSERTSSPLFDRKLSPSTPEYDLIGTKKLPSSLRYTAKLVQGRVMVADMGLLLGFRGKRLELVRDGVVRILVEESHKRLKVTTTLVRLGVLLVITLEEEESGEARHVDALDVDLVGC
jgi:hypothetical protein